MRSTIVKSILLCVGLVFVALLLAGGSKAQFDPKDIVAAWPLDEGEGDRVHDASGNGYDGGCKNGPKWVGGKFGGALSFDGEDDYVLMDDLKLVDAVQEITMGCWVKPGESKHGWANILSGHNDDVGNPPAWGASMEMSGAEVNKFYFIVGLEGNFWQTGGATTQLNAGVWQHFTCVRQGTDIIHYLDGVESARGAVTGDDFLAARDKVRIANWARGGASPRCFMGVVDEAFVFNRALGQGEVEDIMKQGLAELLVVSPAGNLTTTWGNVKNQLYY